ncbi:glycosyltransferase [Marinobacter sp. 1Y8]
MDRRIEIVYRNTGRGLVADGEILRSILEGLGFDVIIIKVPPTRGYQFRIRGYLDACYKRLPWLLSLSISLIAGWRRLRLGYQPLLTIQLQSPIMRYFGAAEHTWLVPNQEWFRADRLIYLKFYDAVVCKTEAARTIFSQWHDNVVMSGFSGDYATRADDVSKPRASESNKNNAPFFIHVAGKNRRKGSQLLMQCWRLQPEWPRLVVVTDSVDRLAPVPHNVEVLTDADDQRVGQLQRDALAVLAPSEVEGFGHTLLEGMARGAIVLSTDAPPMNELVSTERGVLVEASWKNKVRLGDAYGVSVDDMTKAVNRILALNPEQRAAMSVKARAWVKENHLAFCNRFKMLIDENLKPDNQK